MRAFTSLASPASVSRRHSPALIPREFALALRGRRRAGARFSALLRAAGLAVAISGKRKHEHTHLGTQTLHGGQVRDHRAADPQLGAHASLRRGRRRQPDRRPSLHADRARLQVPGKPAAGTTARDLPRHAPPRPAEGKSAGKLSRSSEIFRTKYEIIFPTAAESSAPSRAIPASA